MKKRLALVARANRKRNAILLQQLYDKYAAKLVVASPETKPQLMKQLQKEKDKIILNPTWSNG